MSPKRFTFIIPVYNRPDEVQELLISLSQLDYDKLFEVVIVEDGSTIKSDEITKGFSGILNISYYYKANSGPGDSRNFGMEKAKGDYYLILDSDCILPPQYLKEVDSALQNNYVDCFGGADAAHKSFSSLQKAINHVMTSFLTTGGIRGKKIACRNLNLEVSTWEFQKKPFWQPEVLVKYTPVRTLICLTALLKQDLKRRFFQRYLSITNDGFLGVNSICRLKNLAWYAP